METRVLEGYRISPQQKHLWLLQAGEAGGAYQASCSIRIDGQFNREVLHDAFNTVVSRHEILRTAFRIPPGADFPLQVIEESNQLVYDDSSAEARSGLDEIFTSNVVSGPVFHVRLVQHRPDWHTLLIRLPSLCADSVSLKCLTQEIARSYEAGLLNQPITDEVIQYADVAEWQNQLLEDPNTASARVFWRQYWHRFDPMMAFAPRLPYGNCLSKNSGFSPRSHRWTTNSELFRQLNERAVEYRTEPSTILLTCWHVLLWRLMGQEVVIGVTSDGRTYEELGTSLGLFAKSVPMFVQCSDDLSFVAALRLVDSNMREVSTWQEYMAWEDVPVSTVPDALFLPLAFEYMSYPGAYSVGSVTFALESLSVCVDRYHLKLLVLVSKDRLSFELHYDPETFDGADIRCLANQYSALLEHALRLPSLPLCALSLTFHQAQDSLASDSNGISMSSERQQCVHHLFEEQVNLDPERIAVIYEDTYLTYRELNQRANKLAHYLQGFGVGPEVIVGILVERSLETIVAILGVWKAGGAYLPLDPKHPPNRLALMLTDAQARIVLTQERLMGHLPQGLVRQICVDADWIEISRQPETDPTIKVGPDNLAYIIYTSGSTGIPKGVMIEHHSPINLLVGLERLIYARENGQSLRVSLNAPVSFDASVQQIVMLLRGHCLDIIPDAIRLDSSALMSYLEAHKIDAFDCTPSQLALLLAAGLLARPRVMPRIFLVAGEAIDERMWKTLSGSLHSRFYNIYGPTEATVDATGCLIEPGSMRPTIGRPLDNYTIHVLDDRGQPSPVGVPGELYIGGPGLARGYCGNPCLTADRFVPDPTSISPSGRMYRTGDLVRLQPKGEIVFLGRTDNQVKVRGYRIELEEIEVALENHPSVRDAVVILREDESHNKNLVAYVVFNSGIEPEQVLSQKDLYDFLRSSLPSYMIPATFVMLDHLPLTVGGKVDRGALPEPSESDPEDMGASGVPRAVDEEVLAAIWREVLGVERVAFDENFFALGGDSIRSIQVQSLARARGVSFTLESLFQHQTIRGLISAIRRGLATPVLPSTQPFGLVSETDRQEMPDCIEDAYPLTMLQAGILFQSAVELDQPLFQNTFSIHIRAPLQTEAFRAAVQDTVARHPALRTSFDLANFSQPLQLVHRRVELPIQFDDIRELTPDTQERLLDKFIEAEKHLRLDWNSAPLMRIRICRRTEDTFQFILTEHEAIIDGWSVASMLTELFHIYMHRIGKERNAINMAPVASFRDYVALENETIRSQRALDFWSWALSEELSPPLPCWSFGRPLADDFGHLVVDVPIPPSISSALQQLARDAALPIKAIVLAAHLRVMSLLGGQRDTITGLIFNGRLEETDGDRVLGQFLNAVPLHLRLGEGSWLDLIKDALRSELNLIPFRRYPVTQLQRSRGQNVLFETAFNFTHFHVYQSLRKWREIEILDMSFFEQTDLRLLADFSIHPLTSQLRLTLNCNALSEVQVQVLQEYYLNTLSAIAQDPHAPYSDSVLLSRAEIELFRERNSTETMFPLDKSFGEIFEEQVHRTPTAIAVSCHGESLTYCKLNEKADAVALFLAKHGARPEKIICLVAERGIDCLAAILGIIKTGAAFLLIDPSFPTWRQVGILEHSGAGIALVEERSRSVVSEVLAERNIATPPRVLSLEQSLMAPQASVIPALCYTPRALAYVVYTSGSTGTPKGAMIESASMLNHLFGMLSDLHLTSEDVIAQTASQSFDISIWQFLGALLVGGRVHIFRDEVVQNPAALLSELGEENVTVFEPVPSLLRALMDEVTASGTTRYPLANLRWLIPTGEALPPQLVREWLHSYPHVNIMNAYGPTECADDVSSYCVDSMPSPSQYTIPIGRPMPNNKCYILDENLSPVPIGIPGELYIGGIGVGRGYLDDPVQTACVFLPDPFALEPGARLYKTGDIARYLPDGNLDYLGRRDHQVKLRGFRIELGEIEEVMLQHRSIQEVAVTIHSASPDVTVLVAYVVSRPEYPLNIDEVQGFVEERLPKYMVPAIFVHLDALPRTNNGKINRKALPILEASRSSKSHEIVLPRNNVEQRLLEIWSSLLGTDLIGVTDNFFEIGGDSLIALRLAVRVRRQFSKDLVLADFIQNPTIAELARRLHLSSRPNRMSPLVCLQQGKDHPAVFFVHPAGGSVFCYGELAKALGPEQPFWGLQVTERAANQLPEASIVDMASEYIKAIREIQPTGPYFLGGWSMGGMVALEMAQQLSAQGHDIAIVAMVDTDAEVADRLQDITQFAMLAMFGHDLGLPLDQIVSRFKDLGDAKDDLPLAHFISEAKSADLFPADLDVSDLEQRFRVYEANIRALARYNPQPYSGHILLLRASQQTSGNESILDLGWRRIAGNVDVFVVSGDHNSMMSMIQAEVIAQHVRKYIDCHKRNA